jgi:hypothetical protein
MRESTNTKIKNYSYYFKNSCYEGARLCIAIAWNNSFKHYAARRTIFFFFFEITGLIECTYLPQLWGVRFKWDIIHLSECKVCLLNWFSVVFPKSIWEISHPSLLWHSSFQSERKRGHLLDVSEAGPKYDSELWSLVKGREGWKKNRKNLDKQKKTVK